MKKSVYRESDGRWAWSLTILDTTVQSGTDFETYYGADEAADEAIRIALKDESARDVAHNMSMMKHALSCLSDPARQVVMKQRCLADSSTVQEIAAAYERGIFDYHLVKRGPPIMAKEDIRLFLRDRTPPAA